MADYREIHDSESEYSSDIAFSESEDEEIQTLPYQFEPIVRLDEGNSNNQADVIENEEPERSGNTNWCECENCRAMDTDKESICCNEIDSVKLKIEQYKEETATELSCITRHPGFQSVCLDRYVLETAYYQYRQLYGEVEHTNNERQRYVAYRQLARWCWGYLGKEVRVVLPSCAVNLIRSTFPSDVYKGFSDA
ncbi:P2X purinoceptor 7-like [Ruditapes philippinarum]|uniref:P2X purinoceptor 7-like n=1 Tax=Ruditapes philippinarum TaxID=129788 RepID=UPI00295A5752|nr:P2X purinoceptor 7-like [Ruditapes philippinarum]